MVKADAASELEKDGWRELQYDTVTKVSCHNNCSYQRACVLNAFIRGGRVVHLEQTAPYPRQNDPEIPDWDPRGCQKGLAYAHRMYDPSRLAYPLKRVGRRGEGKWQRVTWGEALADIADNMLDVLSTDGPEAISSFGGSGSLASQSLGFDALWAALGVAASEVNGEIGDQHWGAGQTFGQPFIGCSADNWFYADVILIWGGNPAYTNMTNYHFITEARYKGTKVITISPDYSPSALPADQWVPVNVGSDAALALSIAQVMMRDRLYKAGFVREQTDLPLLVRTDTKRFLRENDLRRGGRDDVFYLWDEKTNKPAEVPKATLALGELAPALEGEFQVNTLQGRVKVKPVFQALKEKLNAEYTPDKASRTTGVSPKVIEQLAREFGQAKGIVNISTFNWGKFYHGDLIERSIILDFVLGGHIGHKGATYNAFTQLATDASIGGVVLRGNVVLQAAAAGDPRFAAWQAEGYTQEMIMFQYAQEMWAKGQMFGTSLFHYMHSGLLELSQKYNSWDPSLKRPIGEYVKEAFDRKWQFITPAPGKDPKIMFHLAAGTLRRARATNVVIDTLLPKLKLMVVVEPRMTSTALFADYVLPASGWYEKWSLLGLGKPEFAYAFLINKAVEPLGESKNEWMMACELARKLQQRARERGILSYADRNGAYRRLDNLYDQVTFNGMYTEEDDEALCRDYYHNAANLSQIPWEEFKEKGLVPASSLGVTVRSIGNACDVVAGEPLIPLTHHTVKKEPYPTLTRRIQFHIDHDLYLELGQELPAHKAAPMAGGDYPLTLTGGHTRWSIHSNHVDDAILLRLQRGQPVMFMNQEDAQSRGVEDGDPVEVCNDVGLFQIIACVSPAIKPGQVVVYQGWDNFQFLGRKPFKCVMASPLNPIHLAGDYFHIKPQAVSFYPGFSDRDTRVQVSKAKAAEPPLSPRTARAV